MGRVSVSTGSRVKHQREQPVCVSIGLTEHTGRGLARVGLTNQDKTKQAYIGRKAYSVCVCVCVRGCNLAQGGVRVLALPFSSLLLLYLAASHPDTTSAAANAILAWTQNHPALTSAGTHTHTHTHTQPT